MRGSTAVIGLLVVLGVAPARASGAHAAPAPPRQSAEYEVKTAYLYNFAKFVDWEASVSEGSDDPLRLCVYGGEPFERALAAIDGKEVGARRLLAEQIRRVQLVDRCHILFIPRREYRLAAELLDRVGNAHVLTVTEFEEPGPPRGIINMVRRDGRIVLQIAARAAAQRGLRISSRLLQLAELTDGDGSGEM